MQGEGEEAGYQAVPFWCLGKRKVPAALPALGRYRNVIQEGIGSRRSLLRSACYQPKTNQLEIMMSKPTRSRKALDGLNQAVNLFMMLHDEESVEIDCGQILTMIEVLRSMVRDRRHRDDANALLQRLSLSLLNCGIKHDDLPPGLQTLLSHQNTTSSFSVH